MSKEWATMWADIKEHACKVCGTYKCLAHVDWGKCSCGTTFDLKLFIGCPSCLEKKGEEYRRPGLKQDCCLCGAHLQDGEEAYTDPMPSQAICLACGVRVGLDKHNWWKIKVKLGWVWTAEEVKAERFR